MKIEELRIGNFVKYRGEVGQIGLLDFVDLFNDNDFIVNYEPILLTEKWLLKFGFTKNKFGYTFGDITILNSEEHYENPVIYFNKRIVIDCPIHVHELQNLFYAIEQTELIYNEKPKK